MDAKQKIEAAMADWPWQPVKHDDIRELLQTLASNAAEVERLREALKFAIEVIEDLDGKDNSCDPKCGTAELRAALTNQQPE